MQRNELNFWNGKVQNMRRDLEMQQNFNSKVLQENQELKNMVQEFQRTVQLAESKEVTLGRQISGLEDDNQRLVKMYE